MLLDGYKSPICPDIGWRVAIPQLATKKGEAGAALEPPSWGQWTGLEDVIATPSWIISKILNGEAKSNVRMVFVRRQSDDCGDAICPSLRKSIFGREFDAFMFFLLFLFTRFSEASSCK